MCLTWTGDKKFPLEAPIKEFTIRILPIAEAPCVSAAEPEHCMNEM